MTTERELLTEIRDLLVAQHDWARRLEEERSAKVAQSLELQQKGIQFYKRVVLIALPVLVLGVVALLLLTR